MRRSFVVGLFLLAVLVLTTGTSAFAVTYLSSDEAHIEQLVNQTRSGVHVKPLAHLAGLQGMARAQAVRMAERGDIYHNPNLSQDITALGVNWRMVGENVGMGPDANTVYQALLNSPHHYENIVRSNFTSIGVGEVNGPGNRIYLVQVFAEIVPSVHAPVHVTPVRTAATWRPAPTATAAARQRPVAAPVVVHGPGPNALFGGLVFREDFGASQTSTSGAGSLLRWFARGVSFWS